MTSARSRRCTLRRQLRVTLRQKAATSTTRSATAAARAGQVPVKDVRASSTRAWARGRRLLPFPRPSPQARHRRRPLPVDRLPRGAARQAAEQGLSPEEAAKLAGGARRQEDAALRHLREAVHDEAIRFDDRTSWSRSARRHRRASGYDLFMLDGSTTSTSSGGAQAYYGEYGYGRHPT